MRYTDRMKLMSAEARARGPRWIAFVEVFGRDTVGEGATKTEAIAHAVANLPPSIARHFA